MIDRLMIKIATSAPICVGLDPTPALIPPRILNASLARYGSGLTAAAAALLAFNREIIDGVYDLVAAVKPQIALYEQFGPQGLKAYTATAAYAAAKGLVVIGDIKRGDIASTASAYAAHLAGVKFRGQRYKPWQADAVTLNPYLGRDSVQPFLEACARWDKAVFLLVKTSNPGSADLQDLPLADGRLVYEAVADLVTQWSAALVGACGYSEVGAVVGGTFPQQGAALRARMPGVFFLVPGYGAQGATGKDLRGFFDKEGKGCLISASRSLLGAWQANPSFGDDIGAAARAAVMEMARDLQG
jgi:orotidine-5'-phosphate decarboxylase